MSLYTTIGEFLVKNLGKSATGIDAKAIDKESKENSEQMKRAQEINNAIAGTDSSDPIQNPNLSSTDNIPNATKNGVASRANDLYEKNGYSKQTNDFINDQDKDQIKVHNLTGDPAVEPETKTQETLNAAQREIIGQNLTGNFQTKDEQKNHNQHIYESRETANKTQFLDAARNAGMTKDQATKELKDIDKRSSIDANDPQALGQNQGKKYDYDAGAPSTPVQRAANQLYNNERDDKHRLGADDKQNAATDNKINEKLGLNDSQAAKTNEQSTKAPTSYASNNNAKTKDNPYSQKNIEAIEKQGNLSNNQFGKVLATEAIKKQEAEKNGKTYSPSNQEASKFFKDAQTAHQKDIKDGTATTRDGQLNNLIGQNQTILNEHIKLQQDTKTFQQSDANGSFTNKNGQSTHQTLTKYSSDNKQLTNDQQAQIAKDKTNQAHNEATGLEK